MKRLLLTLTALVSLTMTNYVHADDAKLQTLLKNPKSDLSGLSEEELITAAELDGQA
jgi:hypothetical protein